MNRTALQIGMQRLRILPALVLVLCPAWPAAGGELALDQFFRDDAYHDLVISPGGESIAAIRSSRGGRNLFVRDLTGDEEVEITRRERPEAVLWATWISDRRLIYGVLEVDRRGTRVVNFHGIDADGANALRLGGEGYYDDRRKAREIRRDIHYFRYADEEIVHWLPDELGKVLVSSDRRSANFRHVYRMSVDDGRRRRVLRAPGRRASYLADHAGIVRIAWTTENDLTNRLLYRSGEDKPWRELGHYRFDAPNLLPLGFTPDGRLYVLSNLDHDKRALYVYDPEDERLDELVFRHPEVDVSDALFSRDHRELIGIVYVTDHRHTHYLDPIVREAAARLERRWPQQRIHFIDGSDDHRRLIFLVDDNRSPGAYYLVDATDAAPRELAAVAPWIDPARMAQTRTVRFEARDGLELDAFLTLPLEREPQALPLVVVPHGGPYLVRDTADFDPEIKFLADRGYAVLQINFRGSAGYGLDFATAGHREWGRAMQDDITDGVRWAIAEGIADPQRICIYGSSYGGYAALMGLVTTPELYRCGASYAGVSDLSLLFEYQVVGGSMLIGDADAQRFWEIVVGDARDREHLRELSPVHRVAAIQAPVFIAHGGRDYIARVEHATRLRAALERHDKRYEWLLVPDEGHGFFAEANRFELYGRLERFLAEHLGE